MNKLLEAVINSDEGISTVPLRVGAGVIFMAHGAQKLFGWFGGYGLEGTGGWMESIGLAPGYLMALMAGSAEFFGGLLLVLGLLVRPSAAVLAITMLVAIFAVHFENGLWRTTAMSLDYLYSSSRRRLRFAVRVATALIGSFNKDWHKYTKYGESRWVYYKMVSG